jgi:hypothetical protein
MPAKYQATKIKAWFAQNLERDSDNLPAPQGLGKDGEPNASYTREFMWFWQNLGPEDRQACQDAMEADSA